MDSFKTVLCPVDFSEFSTRAICYASAIAEQYHARLLFYHCVSSVVAMAPFPQSASYAWEDSTTDAENHLKQYILPYMHHNLSISMLVESGQPAIQILQTARDENVDLIVMGTHGLSGYEAVLMGSVTNKVLHKTKIPVLAVCKPTRTIVTGDPDEPLSIGRILCPVDPFHFSLPLVSRAINLARMNRATLFFLTVGTSPECFDTLTDLREMISPEHEEMCKVEFLHRTGDPQEEIVRAIQEIEADLAVMGHRSKTSMTLEVLGSVTLRVVPQSACPVLVVRD